MESIFDEIKNAEEESMEVCLRAIPTELAILIGDYGSSLMRSLENHTEMIRRLVVLREPICLNSDWIQVQFLHLPDHCHMCDGGHLLRPHVRSAGVKKITDHSQSVREYYAGGAEGCAPGIIEMPSLEELWAVGRYHKRSGNYSFGMEIGFDPMRLARRRLEEAAEQALWDDESSSSSIERQESSTDEEWEKW